MAVQRTDSPTPGQSRTNTPAIPSRSIPQSDLTQEQIAKRAYEIFSTRGGEHGHDQEDWFQAEQELRTKVRQPSS